MSISYSTGGCIRIIFIAFLCFVFRTVNASEQVADSLFYSTPTYVSNPSNALADNGAYARMRTSPGVAIGIGAYSSSLEIGFDSELPANTVTYVRIGSDDESLFEVLLGGSLGDFLADVLGTVLLGNQTITIQAKNSSGTVVLERTSNQGFDSNSFRLVTDEFGNYYLRIQPDQPYQSIRLKNSSGALAGLGSVYNLYVYHAFYYDTSSGCDKIPTFTSHDRSGISIDVLDLNSPISDIENAIDADFENTYSELSLGLLSALGATSEQLFYFDTPVTPGDQVLVSLGTTGSLVDLGLFNFVEIVAYSEGAEIASVSTSSLLDLDLLGLLESGEFFQFPISSDSYAIDQIGVRISSLVSLGAISDVLKISGVYSTPAPPEFVDLGENSEYVICEGEALTIGPEVKSGLVYNWSLDWGGDVFIGQSETLTLPASQSPGTYTYFVRSSYAACSFESLPSQLIVIINAQSEVEFMEIFPSGEATIDEEGYYVYQEGEDPVILTPSMPVAGTNGVYSWYMDEDEGELITDGYEKDGISYSVSSDGTLSIEGLPFTDSSNPIVYYVNYAADENCPADTPASVSLNSILRILNVGLKSFSASIHEKGILIKWEFSKVDPTHTVELERSGKEMEFKSIFSSDAGPSTTSNFLDIEPLEGYNYYRVKVINPEGEVKFISSLQSTLWERFKSKAFEVFPTFFEDVISIKKPAIEGVVRYQLFSQQGNLMSSDVLVWEPGNPVATISGLSQYPSGIYILRVSQGNSMQSFSLIK
ncbi:T9SS type A sorting domain-containing protein [Algoriphagus sp. PAP.12]|uniref:T9SS type A sorting domain-containing protein n=1 Tax=Algoriphagus sp. PAP.12 TaxID=2996678 RepID=UPI00227B5D85|nr:T9SS type A sorting domain-containing protein [Algoriphagus sp. PAP.12]